MVFDRAQWRHVGAVALGLMTSILTPLSATAAEKPQTARLAPLAAEPLPLGQIKPAGWLKRQLEVQANGLGGHLDEFWPDVKDSAWVGGNAEGWERGPYWLDGFIPLAIHLDDPKLKGRAKHWIDYILSAQRPDGWFGPAGGNPDPGSQLKDVDSWPRFIVLKALTQWHEATGDERVIPAMTRFLKKLDTVLDEHPLKEWARTRWADLSISIYWLHDRTHEPWLLDLAAKVHKQGLDWTALGKDFPYRTKVGHADLERWKDAAGGQWINDHHGATHGVNISMGVKAAGVWSRQSGDAADRQASLSLLAALDQYHGQATGMFSCDEHLAQRHPSQGTELCSVVEMMFSLEQLLTVLPEVTVADRLESVAYNALPATFSDDMWAHQYDQQANQVVSKRAPKPIYSTNGPEANLFGLEPHFGCCLANMHQGWPKLVSHLWMRSKDDGLQAMTYAPCTILTKAGGADVRVAVETDYPFTDTIQITVEPGTPAEFPIDLRIPAWTKGATLAVAEEAPVEVKPGTFHRVARNWNGATKLKLTLPMPLRVERRFNDSVSVKRGPLLYALEIGQDWKQLRDQPQGSADWEVFPTTPWNYALAIDPMKPEASLAVKTAPVAERPFDSKSPAIWLEAKGRRVPSWELLQDAAGAPPASPVESTEPEQAIRLIPYGAAKLRVAELPVLRAN